MRRTLALKVTEYAKDERFKHHQWFVKHHLEIVERIAHELCEKYPKADRQFVDALVWLHDYEKIVNSVDEHNTQLVATRKLLQEAGYSTQEIEKLAKSINQYNAKEDLAQAEIEIQIVSSADAASHLVGPFQAIYWYENPTKSIAELQSDNLEKLKIDWEKKVTLPEIRQAFQQRYQNIREIAGELPESFLN